MKTSKQICVEFLEAFIRQTVFVTYHEFRDCSDSHFETFLRYLNRRIRIFPNIRQIGFRIDTVIHNDPEHEKFFKSVARNLKRLWCSHEDHNIPSGRLFIATQQTNSAELIDDALGNIPGYYDNPDAAVMCDNIDVKIFPSDRNKSIRSLANAAAQWQDFFCAVFHSIMEDMASRYDPLDASIIENQLRRDVAGPQQRHEALMKRHDALIHQAADFWTAMEEQYSSALFQNHNNTTSYLLHEQHITPIQNTYGATFTMQESSSEPPSDSSSPDLRHNSTTVAMIKLQQEHKIDYTVKTDEGLGNLRKFPREIRDMIYGFSEPPVSLYEQRTSTLTTRALRRLTKCPLLSTSKQLCVEFLESFVRGKTIVTSSVDGCPIQKFEHFFIFMSKRIDLVSHMHLHCLELAAKGIKLLWDIHKNYNIPVSKLYLGIGYSKTLGFFDFLYKLYGDHLYNDDDALSQVFYNMNVQVFPRNRSASFQSLQSLRNSLAHQQARLDICLQLKLKDIHKRLTEGHALEIDREVRKWMTEIRKPEALKVLVDLQTAIIHQTVDLWSTMEEQDRTDDDVGSAGSKTTME
ncbi:unnamed protein product [Aureobasidium pullulans]|nr:unnamed protein product [Aureobasidium pullulans]